MKRILIVLIIFLLICINASAKDTNTDNAFTTVTKGLVGEWVNELGSTLKITDVDSSSGRISGIYKSSSGTSGKSYPLIGWVNYQSPQPASDNTVVVCFSVHWGQYGSVTTWNGTYDLEKQNPMIKTQWLLVRSNSKFAWDHMLTGSSTFMLNKN